jgi:hypothetical protein
MALWGNTDQANSSPKHKGVVAGPKNYAKQYTHLGSATTITFPTGASYNNADILVVAAASPAVTTVNATFTLVTNATGYIQSLGTINLGRFSANAANVTYAITNSSFGTAAGNATATGFGGTTFATRVGGMQLYNDSTPNDFVNNAVKDLVGVSVNEITLGSGVAPGWILETVGTGPVTAVTVTGGSGFSNGDTIYFANGSSLGTAAITTNATSNAVSATIVNGGSGWTVNTAVVAGFTREKHASALVYTGAATGYANTDYVIVSNSVSNARATVSTNTTGGSLTFTFTSNGIFANTTSNTQVVINIYNANGVANGSGTGATFTAANLVTSTGGTITVNTLGGRAGRKQYETIAVVRQMGNNSVSPTGGSSLV